MLGLGRYYHDTWLPIRYVEIFKYCDSTGIDITINCNFFKRIKWRFWRLFLFAAVFNLIFSMFKLYVSDSNVFFLYYVRWKINNKTFFLPKSILAFKNQFEKIWNNESRYIRESIFFPSLVNAHLKVHDATLLQAYKQSKTQSSWYT